MLLLKIRQINYKIRIAIVMNTHLNYLSLISKRKLKT